MAARFIIVHSDQAPALIGAEAAARQYIPEDCWCLVDTMTGDIVGHDGGEPEDQTLARDWSWVADLANRLTSEVES